MWLHDVPKARQSLDHVVLRGLPELVVGLDDNAIGGLGHAPIRDAKERFAHRILLPLKGGSEGRSAGGWERTWG